MSANKKKKIEIYNQLIELYKKQDKHLEAYKRYLDELIEKESNEVFYQGHDSHFKEIQNLEKELKTLLTA